MDVPCVHHPVQLRFQFLGIVMFEKRYYRKLFRATDLQFLQSLFWFVGVPNLHA